MDRLAGVLAPSSMCTSGAPLASAKLPNSRLAPDDKRAARALDSVEERGA
jgi:hypothetical protein